MSMNLTLHVDGREEELWQTPTHITYMCLMGEDGKYGSKSGSEARRALYMYCEWVRSTLNGSWESDGAYKAAAASVNEHVAYIEGIAEAPHQYINVGYI